MGTIAAAGYALVGVLLLAAGGVLYARESMAAVPFYDATRATDPVALSRLLAHSLVAFGALTLGFAALTLLDRTGEIVVAGYAVGVMAVAVVTAGVTRQYE